MKQIETSRLIIREASMDDAPLFFKIQTQPKWIKYIGDRGIKTVADARQKLSESLTKCQTIKGWELFTVLIKDTLEPIGVTSYVQRDYLTHPDIGYAILTDYEGNGYMLEASKATLEYGVSELDFQKIFGIISLENGQSVRLIEKLGLKKVKVISPNEEELILYEYASS